MPYTTVPDLQARLSLETLLYLVDDERAGEITPEGETRINAALEQAQSEADAYIAQKYPVPLPSVPLVVKSRVLDIAVYRLFLRRGIRTNTADEVVLQANRDAVRFFENVAVGKASLPVPGLSSGDSNGTINSNSGARITSPPRLFSRETLKDF
jgi:phage gp36-like protein